jgi:hypothetical protein
MEESKELSTRVKTAFDVPAEHRLKAILNLLKGRTPSEEVFQRPARGGGAVNYVKTYYMTQVANLVFGWRWTSKCLEQVIDLDNNEVRVHMLVIVWDEAGHEYSHDSWGGSEIARWTKDSPDGKHKVGSVISMADSLKSGYSDGIKKCLSYFGIAADVYGGKEIDIESELGEESTGIELDNDKSKSQASRAFNKYVDKIGMKWSDVFKALGVTNANELTDYKQAYKTLKAIVEKEDKSE